MSDTPKDRDHLPVRDPEMFPDGRRTSYAPAGLDFVSAHKAGVEALLHPDGPTVAERAHLQAQHRALLAAAVAEARRDEGDRLDAYWREEIRKTNEAMAMSWAMVAPLVAAVREWQEANEDRWKVWNIHPPASYHTSTRLAEAEKALAALPLPPEVP